MSKSDCCLSTVMINPTTSEQYCSNCMDICNHFEDTYVKIDVGGVPDTGFRCAICFEYAQVLMENTTLCVDHAKRYNFGYGVEEDLKNSLKAMREEFDTKG